MKLSPHPRLRCVQQCLVQYTSAKFHVILNFPQRHILLVAAFEHNNECHRENGSEGLTYWCHVRSVTRYMCVVVGSGWGGRGQAWLLQCEKKMTYFFESRARNCGGIFNISQCLISKISWFFIKALRWGTNVGCGCGQALVCREAT
jgi:hypothetical protein